MLAGVAGALYVPQVGIINPSEFAPATSIEVVIWVAVGGRGTLVGAALGALAVNAGKTWFTGAIPELWLFALGALVRRGYAAPAEGHGRHCVRACRATGRASDRREVADPRPFPILRSRL